MLHSYYEEEKNYNYELEKEREDYNFEHRLDFVDLPFPKSQLQENETIKPNSSNSPSWWIDRPSSTR